MQDSQFNPTPKPSSKSELSTRKKGFRLLAIIVGVIVDLGGTNVAAACYALFVVGRLLTELAARGLSRPELQAQLQGELEQALSGSVLMTVVGLLLSVLGGYVAGRLAGYAEVLHGAATGVGVALVSVILTLVLRLPVSIGPLWRILLSLGVNIGSTTLGGYLAQLQRTRRRPRVNPVSP